MPPIKLKCVVVGDGGVGKTSFLISGTTNSFPTEYIGTVFDNYSMTILVDLQEYTIDLWDTAGQDDYQRLRALSYPNTQVFIICFSISDWQSFERVSTIWHPEVTEKCSDASIILLGTKIDLREDRQTIELLHAKNLAPLSFEQGLQKSKEIKAAQYLECSSLSQQGLTDVFEQIVICTLNHRSPQRNKKQKCTIM